MMIRLLTNEKGSVLAIALICLMILSMFGIFALNTSDNEVSIAANQQRWEKNFNISEGGTMKEGSKVGYAGVNGSYTWYQVVSPDVYDVPLVPNTLATFDPSGGQDIPVAGSFPADFYLNSKDPNYWPRENLMDDTAGDTHDYAYLVTYQFGTTVGQGTDAGGNFTEYHFRINARQKIDIEIGGTKIGVKLQ